MDGAMVRLTFWIRHWQNVPDELKNVNLRGGILLKPLAVFAREDAGEHFTWNSWHMSGIERKLIAADVLTILRSATPNCLVITVNPHVRTMLQ